MMVNAWWEPLHFVLPPAALNDENLAFNGHPWHRWIDTALPSPSDIVRWSEAVPLQEPGYTVQPRALVALVVGQPGG